MADRNPNPCIVKWILSTWYLNSPPFGRAAPAIFSGSQTSANTHTDVHGHMTMKALSTDTDGKNQGLFSHGRAGVDSTCSS